LTSAETGRERERTIRNQWVRQRSRHVSICRNVTKSSKRPTWLTVLSRYIWNLSLSLFSPL